ncbi:MAG: hypothetical protein M1812_006043 [Candelaria pacifica]|nr:MAG: hypothetical protein M1812_006043 [Candelaria pacifica]
MPWWQGRLQGTKKQVNEQISSKDEREPRNGESGSTQSSRGSRDNQTTALPAGPAIVTTAPDNRKTPSPQTTPKASFKTNDVQPKIPPLDLNAASSPEKVTSSPHDGGYRQKPISGMPSVVTTEPNPSPDRSTNSTTNATMLPPPRPSALRPPPSGASNLRAPNAGPLPNRSPTAATTSSLSLPPSITQKPTKPRQKVILTPGHSPLDWARLQKSGTDLRGVSTPRLIPVPPSLLRKQNGRKGKDAWSVWQGKVYNITPYLPFHPGGENELMKAAGRDGNKLFMEVHPWVNWENMLGQCLIGVLVDETVVDDAIGSNLEQMD